MANEQRFGTRTNLSTTRADLTGVIRLNFNNFDAFYVGFVSDKALQLAEAPITYPVIHPSPSVCFSYSFEVFQNNLVSFETGNNVFTDVVVNPSHVTSFPSTKLFQQPLSRPCAFGLEFSSEIFESSFGLLHNTTIKEFSLTCNCEVVYSEVNTQNGTLRATALLNGINLFRECEYEKASALPINTEQALRNIPSEISFVANGNVEFELLSTFEQSQNKNISFEVSTSWEIVSDRSPLDQRLVLSLLNHTTSLRYAGNSKLSRKSFPEMFIDEWVELNIIPYLSTPSLIDTILQRFSISLDSSDYFISLIDSDFSTDGCSHTDCKEQRVFKTFGNEETGFLPYLKIGVSALTTL